jgi:hypothetical protein
MMAWAQTNRTELSKLGVAIKEQAPLKRLLWSRPPENVIAIFKDDSILHGDLDANNWAPDKKAVILDWISRVKATGCHGFDCPGTNWEVRLYLDVNVYVAIPATSNTRLVEHYESWVDKGRDVRGDICAKLSNGWYLCSERR